MSVSVAWCANGAIVWDAGADEVVQERHFDPSALAVAMHRLREVLPGAGVALLSARTMLLDETYLGLRYKRAYGAQVFSDIEAVLSQHRIAMVAVRHPRLAADHLLAPTAEAFAGVGVASFAGLNVVDIVPRTTTKAMAVADEMASMGCAAEQPSSSATCPTTCRCSGGPVGPAPWPTATPPCPLRARGQTGTGPTRRTPARLRVCFSLTGC